MLTSRKVSYEENVLEYFFQVFHSVTGVQQSKIRYAEKPVPSRTTIFKASIDIGAIDFTRFVKYGDFFVFADLIDEKRLSKHPKNYIPVDLVKASFVFLTNYMEYEHERKKGRSNDSYFSRLGLPKKLFEKPWVNYYVEHVMRVMGMKSKKKDFSIMFSHDVDYLKKNFLLRLKKTVFSLFSAMKRGRKPLKGLLPFLLKRKKYDYFQHILLLEKQYGTSSCFFFYSKIRKRPVSFLIDPSYDIKDRNLPFSSLAAIGLHGSYDSAYNHKLLAAERKKLAKITHKSISFGRQHWLRFSPSKTVAVWEAAGIQYDSTLGFNDLTGFRNAICSPFPLFDLQNNRISSVVEIPLIAMDSTFFDYYGWEKKKTFKELKRLVDETKRFGGCVSLNWHLRTVSEEYGWYTVYEKVMEYITSSSEHTSWRF